MLSAPLNKAFPPFLNEAPDIPHFKKVVLMVTLCDECGYKESEVKGGTGIEPKGIRIDLHITDKRDMTRDVIKVSPLYLRWDKYWC